MSGDGVARQFMTDQVAQGQSAPKGDSRVVGGAGGRQRGHRSGGVQTLDGLIRLIQDVAVTIDPYAGGPDPGPDETQPDAVEGRLGDGTQHRAGQVLRVSGEL